MNRSLKIFISILLVFTVLTLTWVFAVAPQLEIFARQRILEIASDNSFAQVEFSRIHLRLLTGAIAIENLKLEFKDPKITSLTQNLEIQQVTLHADFLALLFGQFGIRKIIIDQPVAQINLEQLLEDDGLPPQKIPTQDIFKILNPIPVDSIEIVNSRLKLFSKKHRIDFHFNNVGLELYKRHNQIQGRLDAQMLRGETPDVNVDSIRFSADILLNPKEIELQKFAFQTPALTLEGGGKFFDFENLLIFPKASFDLALDADFKKLQLMMKSDRLQKPLSSISGKLKFKGQLTLLDFKRVQGKFETQFEAVSWKNLNFGNGEILGRFQNDQLLISDIELEHPAGKINLSKTEISFENEIQFKTHVQTQKFDLKALFESLHLNKVPVWLHAQLDAPCSGNLNPPKINCTVNSQLSDLIIRPSPNTQTKPIIAVPKGSVEGKVQFTAEKITYEGLLSVATSKAKSTGEISFKKGFQISYESDFVELSDISPLAGLQLSGKSRLSGTTEGNADTAKMNLQIQIQDFIFEDYQFGELAGNVSLKSGQLIFDDLKGLKGSSNYIGYLLVDLLKDQLRGQFDFPQARLQDLTHIHSRRLEIPFEIVGQGFANVEFSGPFDFWQMDTKIRAQFRNIILAGENFDSLQTQVNGKSGNMIFEATELKKSRGDIRVQGKIGSDKNYGLTFEARNMVLEESALLAKLSSNIYGQLNFSGQVTGQFNDPLLELKANVTNTVLDEQELDSTFMNLRMTKDYFFSNFQIFGQKMVGDLQIPLGQSTTPYRIKAKMNSWRFGELFALTGSTSIAGDYTTEVTGEIDITSVPRALETTRGTISLTQFAFGRGGGILRNKESVRIDIQEGNVQVHSFALASSNQFLILPPQKFSLNQMNMEINGKLDVHLFHVFIPTLEDLGGLIALDLRVEGTWIKPELFGTLQSTDAIVRIRGLPHPIERIQAQAKFSRSRLNIEEAKALFAGGQMKGSGFIQFEGIGKAPMNIKVDVKGMNLNIPDKVRTSGDASLLITGEEFPYLMSGNYTVLDGLIERDFLSGSDRIEVKQSIYLPQSLKKENIPPLVFDLQILIDQPLAIKNPQAEGSLTGKLNLRGSPTNPLLFGKIQLDRETLITFRDKTFNLQNGVIEFNHPSKISPDLFISAQTRVAEYDINLMLLGSSDQPDLRLTSVPALPLPDLLSLLALGVTPTAAENTQSTEQARRTGFELGAVIFSNNPLNRQIQDRLGVNIQLTTTLDSTKNVNVPKVIASRRLTKKINATASRSLGGDETVTEMRLQYLINKNVSAIGSFESRESTGTTNLNTTEQEQKNIFGVDLEYRRDFK